MSVSTYGSLMLQSGLQIEEVVFGGQPSKILDGYPKRDSSATHLSGVDVRHTFLMLHFS